MIELKNITFSFSSTPVLRDFSLSVASGEHIAIMGASGSGKSTVLKLISGQLQPQEGVISVRSNRISFMFQDARLLPWLTAAENVNLVLGDSPSTLSEAVQWLDKVGLSESAHKYPSELSGGMQQRVALARALAFNGDIILLDEPLSSLDAALAEQMLLLIKQHCKEKTVVFVTHSAQQAKAFADKIYVIKKQDT